MLFYFLLPFLFGLFPGDVQPQTTTIIPQWVEVAGAIGLALSLAGNIVQGVVGWGAALHKRDLDTIASLERSHSATKGELEGSQALVGKIRGELDSVSEEYSTLVGLDVEQLLSLARDGMHIEIVRLKKERQALERRLSRYESNVTNGQATGSHTGEDAK